MFCLNMFWYMTGYFIGVALQTLLLRCLAFSRFKLFLIGIAFQIGKYITQLYLVLIFLEKGLCFKDFIGILHVCIYLTSQNIIIYV